MAKQQSQKFNTEHKLLTFNVGDRVLLKSLNVCQSIDNTVDKFFRLYNGLFRLPGKVAKNTFIVVKPNNNKKIVGNKIMLQYYENCMKKNNVIIVRQ